MKIYPKKLRNLNDLERERSRLLKKKRQLDKEEFLPGMGLFGGDGGSERGGGIGDMLQFSNPVVSLLKDIIIKRITRKDRAPEPEPEPYQPRKKKNEQGEGKSILKKLAFEFVGGYLKWKAIELSYKGIRHLLRSRKS